MQRKVVGIEAKVVGEYVLGERNDRRDRLTELSTKLRLLVGNIINYLFGRQSVYLLGNQKL